MPKIRGFAEKIDTLEKNNENVLECIRRFDEDISEKANKTAVTLFANQVGEQYMKLTYLDT